MQNTLPESGENVDLIGIAEVRRISHLSESAVYRAVTSGAFPKPIKLGPKTSRWIRLEIENWFATKIAERHQ